MPFVQGYNPRRDPDTSRPTICLYVQGSKQLNTRQNPRRPPVLSHVSRCAAKHNTNSGRPRWRDGSSSVSFLLEKQLVDRQNTRLFIRSGELSNTCGHLSGSVCPGFLFFLPYLGATRVREAQMCVTMQPTSSKSKNSVEFLVSFQSRIG